MNTFPKITISAHCASGGANQPNIIIGINNGQIKDHQTTTVKEKKTNQNISNKNRKVISVNNLIHDSAIKTKLRCLNTNSQSL